MLTLDRVYRAAHTLRGVVRETDLIPAPDLLPGCALYLKPENLQLTGSFKLRGAYFKIASLSAKERENGVVACSAGNHAQGVALAARQHGIPATIFIPTAAPLSKVEATRQLGAQIQLVDGVYDDAYTAALESQKKSNATFVHPFDDADVIAGQGTIALELLEQLADMQAVVVPVGGGGLISGIAYTIKQLNPNCKVYGVQAAGAAGMAASMKSEQLTRLTDVLTFADGIAVKNPGEHTFSLCKTYVDDIVTVSDDEVATALLTLLEQQKLLAEGAGAVSVAAAMFRKLPLEGKKTVCLVSGGNIDVNILSRVIHRGLITTGRISDLTITLLDKPGQLKDVSAIIAAEGANVIKVNHNYGSENTDINGCFLHITMETRNRAHLQAIQERLTQAGYDLSEHK